MFEICIYRLFYRLGLIDLIFLVCYIIEKVERSSRVSGKYIAFVPAYEPELVLIDVLEKLKKEGFRIVVVNDGSGEGFAELFKRVALYADAILEHSVNKGKGAAIKTGLSYIYEHYEKDSIVVTVDADGQHRAEDAMKLCSIAEEHGDTLVLGSRQLKENIPLRSRFGNSVTRLVYRLSTGLKVHDTQTGLRAFSMKLIPELLKIPGDRYEYEMNVLLEFARRRIPIVEETIETIYLNDNSSSHFNALKDSCRIYKEILKFSASSFIGFIVDYLMYSLLICITSGLGLRYALRISNIGARMVSATVNYTLNRRFVFKSESGVARSAIQYFLLAVVILCGNTLVLEVLVGRCGINQMLAKILTEIIFFVISWLVQRCVIFRKKN